jgi:PRTRC genetic system protein C
MQIRTMERIFRYVEGKSMGGLTLPDPDPSLDVERVRALFCTSFPEITTAALIGPEAVGDRLVYTFTNIIWREGLNMPAQPWRERR